MAEKSVIFSTLMVQAILDERKTQFREVRCNLPESRYQPGDLLWVKETWAYRTAGIGYIYRADGKTPQIDRWKSPIIMPKEAARLLLAVTRVRPERLQDISEADALAEGIDCRMDGTDREYGFHNDWWWHYDNAFAHLWDSLNAKRGYGWDTNPWVWVYTFEVTQ